jgi:hypothetical protein
MPLLQLMISALDLLSQLLILKTKLLSKRVALDASKELVALKTAFSWIFTQKILQPLTNQSCCGFMEDALHQEDLNFTTVNTLQIREMLS